MKTTLYLPGELKEQIERAAAEEGLSEADVIRRALHEAMKRRQRPAPRVPLTGRPLGDPSASTRVDELLGGRGR